MKNILLIGVVFMAALGSNLVLAGQDSTTCIDIKHEGSKVFFKNSCSYQVTVAWCSLKEKVNGKECGQQGDNWNPYYTEFLPLKAQEEHTLESSDIKYIACKGLINKWDTKDKFNSDANGEARCEGSFILKTP